MVYMVLEFECWGFRLFGLVGVCSFQTLSKPFKPNRREASDFVGFG